VPDFSALDGGAVEAGALSPVCSPVVPKGDTTEVSSSAQANFLHRQHIGDH
jgi:hypothetical protein